MFNIYISNEWSQPDIWSPFDNVWTSFTENIVDLSAVPVTGRNEDYSLVLNNITFSLSSPPYVPVEGDRVKVTREDGVGFYLGYVKSSSLDEDKKVYKITVEHFLQRTKEVNLANLDFREKLEADDYGDTLSFTVFSGGYYLTIYSYSVRSVIRAILETSCEKLFNSFDVSGVDYDDGTTITDFFVNHYFNDGMLYTIGLENTGVTNPYVDSYKYSASSLFTVLNAICIQCACNIFVADNVLDFNGTITSTATIKTQADYNESITFAETNSTIMKIKKKEKKLEIKFSYSPKFADYMGEYYGGTGEGAEPTQQIFLPQQSQYDYYGTREWKKIAIPNHFLIFDGTYINADAPLSDLITDARFFTPMADDNSFVPHYLYSMSSLGYVRELYVDHNDFDFHSSTMGNEKKNVLRLDIKLDKLQNSVKQLRYGE